MQVTEIAIVFASLEAELQWMKRSHCFGATGSDINKALTTVEVGRNSPCVIQTITSNNEMLAK
jgi:hypothetical protein